MWLDQGRPCPDRTTFNPRQTDLDWPADVGQAARFKIKENNFLVDVDSHALPYIDRLEMTLALPLVPAGAADLKFVVG